MKRLTAQGKVYHITVLECKHYIGCVYLLNKSETIGGRELHKKKAAMIGCFDCGLDVL